MSKTFPLLGGMDFLDIAYHIKQTVLDKLVLIQNLHQKRSAYSTCGLIANTNLFFIQASI